MTVRTDLTYDMETSPRLITVAAPSTELTIQDLHDTVVNFQDSEEGGQFPRLILSAGKEALGGGVSVGITSTLQNAQIAFEARTTPLETGSVTTAGTTTLIDSTATFQTNNVARGDLVFNETDSSQATVVSVTSETELVTTALTGGVSNDFADSDAYSIYDVVQCDISGGNLVAIDSANAELAPVFPTFGTQVVRTASSSATTQSQAALEFSTFNGAVHIDVLNGVTGTDGTKGNEAEPVNNLADAKIIAAARGLGGFHIMEPMTFGATDDIDGYIISGEGASVTTLTFTSGVTTSDVTYSEVALTGTINGSAFIYDCHLSDIAGIGGTATDSTISNSVIEAGTITLRSDNSKNIRIIDCSSGVAGASTPVLDVNGATGDITIHHYAGGIKLINITSAINVTADTSGGHIILDTTCTDGTVVIRGDTKITDNSGAGCTVVDETSAYLNWQQKTEGTFTAEEIMRLMASALAGKLSGAETTTVTIRDINDTKDRITATVDTDGNRTAVTLDAA